MEIVDLKLKIRKQSKGKDPAEVHPTTFSTSFFQRLVAPRNLRLLNINRVTQFI